MTTDPDKPTGQRTFARFVAGTPARTFFIYPLGVIAFELALSRGSLTVVAWGAPPMLWGYLQYRLTGAYRVRRGDGGPGIDVPPRRLVTDGPYRYTRNPMYLGHLIFMLGLALTLWSWSALALFLVHVVWFHRRVLDDERRLTARFGVEYADYMRRVKRWVPGVR